MRLFPFPSPRRGQEELLEDARMVASSSKILVAYAPAGIGKTAAALSAFLEFALDSGKNLFFLTSKRTQHFIAVETLRKIKEKEEIRAVDIIAKQAMCPRKEAKLSQDFIEWCSLQQKTGRCVYYMNNSQKIARKVRRSILHVEELIEICSSAKLCPYKVALEVMEDSCVVCDYNYIFSEILDSVLSRTGMKIDDLLLIVDEAHNLPERVRNNYSGSLTPSCIRDSAEEISVEDRKLGKEIGNLARIFHGKEREVGKEILEIDESFLRDLRGYAEMFIENGLSPSLHLANFLDEWMKDYNYLRVLSNSSLSYRLLDPSEITGEIFGFVHSSILMSGTLYPMEVYANILGIPEKRRVLKAYPSPFPKSNTLILISKGTTTRYDERSRRMFRLIARKIEKFVEQIPRNVAVFFPSYEILDSVRKELSIKKKILTEKREMSKVERENLLDQLLSFKNMGAVLLAVQGGSLSEGIDYYNNLLDGVIVVGLPLAPPSLESKSIINYYERVFHDGIYYGYILPAMNKVLQAMGRLIRSENDRGVVILIDDRFLLRKYLRCFPKDFEFLVTRAEEKAVREFFSLRSAQRTLGEQEPE